MHKYIEFLQDELAKLPSAITAKEIDLLQTTDINYYPARNLDELLNFWKTTAVIWKLLNDKIEPASNMQPTFEEAREFEESVKGLTDEKKKLLFYKFVTNYARLDGETDQMRVDDRLEVDFSSFDSMYSWSAGNHAAQDQGPREYQEDMFVAGVELCLLPTKYDSYNNVKNIVSGLISDCSIFEDQGSTCLLTEMNPCAKTITVGSIGDSRCYALIKKSNGSIVIKPLTSDQKPTNQLCQLRALESNFKVANDDDLFGPRRINGLAVGGALGDHGKLPESHIDISQFSFDELDPDDRCVIIASSDGLFELNRGSKIIIPSSLFDQSEQTIANYLIAQARQHDSHDNITIQVIHLDHTTQAQELPTIYGLFDGHGGDQCSKWAKQTLTNLLGCKGLHQSAVKTELKDRLRAFVCAKIEEGDEAEEKLRGDAFQTIFDETTLLFPEIKDIFGSFIEGICQQKETLEFISAQRILMLYLKYCSYAHSFNSHVDEELLANINSIMTKFKDKIVIKSLPANIKLRLRQYFSKYEMNNPCLRTSLYTFFSEDVRLNLSPSAGWNEMRSLHSQEEKIAFL